MPRLLGIQVLRHGRDAFLTYLRKLRNGPWEFAQKPFIVIQ
jgi:hypothetical protein